MTQEKRTCSFCNTPQTVEEDPDFDVEQQAYGSNNAGLRFKRHPEDDPACKGSGVTLQ